MKIGLILSVIVWLVLGILLTGCSVKLELGYHGETGRDDRVQTQLVENRKK